MPRDAVEDLAKRGHDAVARSTPMGGNHLYLRIPAITATVFWISVQTSPQAKWLTVESGDLKMEVDRFLTTVRAA